MFDRTSILKDKVCPPEYEANLAILLDRLNKMVVLINKAGYTGVFKITSGLRTLEEHIAIYAKKGITDKAKIPMKSKHLYCQACDLYDESGKLKKLVKANDYAILKECDLYMEAETACSGWLHVDICKRTKREFLP